MSINNELLIQKANEVEQYVRTTRGFLHQYPEETAKEFETSKFLQKEMDKLGLPMEMVSTTGFIATLDTGKPGKKIALRADIDALPMPESFDNLKGPKKYVSKNEGVCHACGHDAHMAMLLGAAKVLVELKDQLTGIIYICFEEGEERGTGIWGMIDGLKARGPIDAMWGIHVTSFMPAGTINVDAGPRMAGPAGISFEVIGRGGHGSRPDLSVNPVFAAANILTGIGTAWPNRIDAEKTVTLGLATIHGGTAANIIPDSVKIGGTLRFFDVEEGKKAVQIIKDVATYTAKAHNCEVKFEDLPFMGTPVVNDDAFAADAQQWLGEVLPEGTITHGNKWYASEGFGIYARELQTPVILAFLGVGNPEYGSGAEHHNVHFDVDEDVLKIGVLSTIKIATALLDK